MQVAPGAPDDLADAVFRVGRAYGMTADRRIYQAVAVTDGRITAVGRSRDELDSFIGPGTAVIDDPELVLYPALFGPLVLSPLQWQVLVLVPVIGVVAGFIGLRLYERPLRRRESEKAG